MKSRPLAPRAEGVSARGASGLLWGALADAQELDVEVQFRLRRDGRRPALLAVRELVRDLELPRPADLHADEALVPPLDDLAAADAEAERVAAVLAAVELLAILERAGVMHLDGVADLDRGAGALLFVEVLQ